MERPWGDFIILAKGKDYVVKLLTINKGHSISLQRHLNREETWVILEGTGLIVLGTRKKGAKLVKYGDVYHIPKQAWHRIGCETRSKVPMKILEVQRGICEEEDVERLEDQYGRV